MKQIELYGHSDDLIEVDGDLSEELYANYEDDTEFQIGEWRLKASYDGEWTFIVLDHPDGAMWERLSVGEHAAEDDPYNTYSELVRLSATDDAEVSKGLCE